jgi:TRAP-type mannitol/chloroaromatic compound transport system substrate-binding protein
MCRYVQEPGSPTDSSKWSTPMNAWLYHGGGQKLWEEVYAPFNLVPLTMGNTGVQMTGWFRKPIEKIDDFKGLKMRIPGLAGKVYAALGVDVKLLPAGEIFPALEPGVIDAAEFVGPFQDRRLGLHKAAKFYHTTGWHESSTVTELISTRPRLGVAARGLARNHQSRGWRLQRHQPGVVRCDQCRGA